MLAALLSIIGAVGLAAMALLANAALRRWQYEREHWTAQLQNMTEIVDSISDLALKKYLPHKKLKAAEVAECDLRLLLETTKITSVWVAVRGRVPVSHQKKINDAVQALRMSIAPDYDTGQPSAQNVITRSSELYLALVTTIASVQSISHDFRRSKRAFTEAISVKYAKAYPNLPHQIQRVLPKPTDPPNGKPE